MKTCDLHVHSHFSDGTDTPQQLIENAQKAGLSAIALTDHNTVAGLPALLSAAQGSGVEVIPGCEFTTEHNGDELHILGLFIAPEHYEQVNGLLEQFMIRKSESNRHLVERLRGAGIELNYDSIAKNAMGSVNRAVIAAEMVRKGYCESVKAAFSDYLSASKGYYIPPQRLGSVEVIRFIKSIGAVAVLAHPFLTYNEEQLRAFLELAVPAGLDGMEVQYSAYDEQTTARSAVITEDFGILQSGGSDYHGMNKPHISIGVGQGNLCIPFSLAEMLRKRAAKRSILNK